jgi:hypothetical protein
MNTCLNCAHRAVSDRDEPCKSCVAASTMADKWPGWEEKKDKPN